MAVTIAYTVNQFGPGGLERCVAHLVDGLDRDRFYPLIVSLNRVDTVPDWIERNDVPILSLNKANGNDPLAIYRLARMLKRNNVALVQSHNWGTLLETSIACRAAGARHIHTEHGQQERVGATIRGLKRRVHKQARLFAFRRCQAVVACAESVAEGIQTQWGFPTARVSYIANGARRPMVQNGQNHRRDLGIPASAFVVGSVGRLIPLKAFDNLIRATQLLLRQGIEAHLVLVGDGPEQSHLQQLASELNISANVHLVGYHDQPGSWLATFDCYANSSTTEAMSMSILEAMSLGVPIVATDVGDSRVLVERDGRCGSIVPVGNSHEMAAALCKLAGDPKRRQQQGATASDKFNRLYTVSKMLRNYELLYDRVMASREPGFRLQASDFRLQA